ncbi:MAG: calcium-translocating P-type ATPase, SERCA-type [Candidatus Altiarchaeota archaeon]|nr:calcium-translocating P-type ATPase, SERCA-type [Candidatus Altiarchaeota archaeon]
MADEVWHSMEIEDLLQEMGSSLSGLSEDEVGRKLSGFGPNEIRGQARITPLQILLEQFKNFLVIILIAAAIASLGIGVFHGSEEDILEATAIIFVVIFIAVTGFIQEYRAEKELEALKSMVSPTALVIRNGKKEEIPARDIVPGDIILVEAGDKIPADSRLLDAINLSMDEASLTGESLPVEKEVSVLKEETALGDRRNMVFMGTNATYGKGTAIVVETGMKTQLGKIAEKIQTMEAEKTPLQVRLDLVGRQIGWIVIILCSIIFIAGMLKGEEPVFMFLVAVALAVAAVPEGLPAVVTVTLARGMRLMVKKNAIVRKLTAVETLGSTDIICSDKTGTLTRNEMTIRRIYVNNRTIEVTGEGYKPSGEFLIDNEVIDPTSEDLQLILRIGTLCNNSSLEKTADGWRITGDPTEASLVVAASKARIKQSRINEDYPRIAELPFDSNRKRMTTIHKTPEGEKFAYVKGAPDVILNLCKYIYQDGGEVILTDEDRERILSMNDLFAGDALRILGAAYRRLDHVGDLTGDLERDLVFVGLLGMIDPPREDAKKAVRICKKAGIKPIMITGDYKLTAIAVAKELEMFIEGDTVLTGVELDRISDNELEGVVDKVTIYARVSPEHKLKIVKALKNRGHIVAMTGDGVNDAPALKKADIGVAMGITGTDVTKEASDMVLTDDNFASIVSAVAEGRGIYDNIKLFIKYLLSCNIGEVMTIFIGMMALGRLPLLPLQILWMNLLTDAAPALALGWNPPDPDIMNRKPRNPKEQIITKKTITRFVGIGVLMGAGTLFAFNYMNPSINETQAQTMAFTTLVLFQMFYVLSCRSEKFPFFRVGALSNGYLIMAVIFSVLMQIAVVGLPLFQTFFGTTTLSITEWSIAILISSSAFLIPEILKYKKVTI